MHLRRSTRGLAALFAASAFVLLAAAPASAAVNTGVVQAGSSITINGTPPTVFPLGSPPTTPNVCAPNPTWAAPSIDVDFDGAGGTSISGPGAYHFAASDFVAGGTTFQIKVNGVAATTGTVTGGTISQGLSVEAVVSDCAGVQKCKTKPIALTVTGTWTGGLTSSGTATVSGTSPAVTAFPGCNTLVAGALVGKTITGNLTLVFP